jgi:hypothetical protein
MFKIPPFRKKRIQPADDDIRSGASPVTVTLENYRTGVWTGGTQAAESIVIPSGEWVGQRKLITLDVLTDPSDTAVINGSNVQSLLLYGETPGAVSTVTLGTADEYCLLEWTGAAWNLLYTDGTVA